MSKNLTNDLIEDVIDGIAFGALAESLPRLSVIRRGSSVLDVDLDEAEFTYVVTVARVRRSKFPKGTDV